MILNPERHIKINWNRNDIDATIITSEHDVVVEFKTKERANNILIICKEDLLERK